ALYFTHRVVPDLIKFCGHLFGLPGCLLDLFEDLLELAGLFPDNPVSLGAPLFQLLGYVPDHLLAEGFMVFLFLFSESLLHTISHITILFLLFAGILVA